MLIIQVIMSGPTKSKSSSTKCKSITSYFTPKGSNVPQAPSTICPLCLKPASIRDINQHLDNGCPESPINFDNQGVKNYCSQTQKVCEEKNNTHKISYSANEDVVLDEPGQKGISKTGDGSDIHLVNCSAKEETVNINEDENTCSTNKSIFNSPVKGKNTTRLAKISPFKSSLNSDHLTPSKSHKKLHLPSPTKQPQYAAKLLLAKSEDNSLEHGNASHIPLTQSRRQDPRHVPYYLTNFETVLRGVLEETDDGELFLSEEIEYVNKFRNLSLEGRKLYVRLFQRKHTWLQVRF